MSAGTLSVNGSIASSSLTTVKPDRTLGGYGTVGNTMINGGTLSPGNSTATLTAAGNLVLTAASTYMVEVSPTASDLTHVTGSATLSGTTVTAVATTLTNFFNSTGGIPLAFGAFFVAGTDASFRRLDRPC